MRFLSRLSIGFRALAVDYYLHVYFIARRLFAAGVYHANFELNHALDSLIISVITCRLCYLDISSNYQTI